MADTVSKAVRSRIMAAIRSKDTAPEMVVRRLAHSLGFRFRLHVRGLPGTPDLVFPARRKVVNVHGCFWHMHHCGRCRIPSTRRAFWRAKLTRNRERDRKTTRQLRRLGWKVLTVWECEAQPKRLPRLTERLGKFLKGRK
ncbi:MAG: very short patch repair endonuclease [Planctomycetota bacterium]|nr:very short patch repair endonuclease [Planctomycetota bacterium]